MMKNETYCGSNCLLEKYAERKAVIHGETEESREAQIINGGASLLLPIRAGKRDEGHPLGMQHGEQEHKFLWRRIQENPHRSLMEVEELCSCSVKVKAVSGIPLYNARTTPDWLKERVSVSDYLDEHPQLDHTTWAKLMSDLCAGLEHMHKLGIAHGDAYPFNVMISAEGNAVWVDFGNMTDDSTYFTRDVLCFVMYTVLFTMKHCDAYSEDLIQGLCEALGSENSVGALSHIRKAVTGSYNDWNHRFTGKDIDVSFFRKFTGMWDRETKDSGSALLHMAVYGNLEYYDAFLYWMKVGSIYERNLNTEREKFHLYSAEIDRLTVPRYKVEEQEHRLKEVQETYNKLWEEHINQTQAYNEACAWSGFLNDELNQAIQEEQRKRIEAGICLDRIREVMEWHHFSQWIKAYSFFRELKRGSAGQKLQLIKNGIKHLFRRDISLGIYQNGPKAMIYRNIDIAKEVLSQEYERGVFSQAQPGSDTFKREEAPAGRIVSVSDKEDHAWTKTPKVSVLLPVYNHAQFVDRAIGSVLNQTYANLELIVLDDGSKDDLAEKMKSYQYDYRVKFYSQPNQKLPTALTHLHQLATGEFITWTSADNMMEPNMIEVLVRELLLQPAAQMVFGDVRLIDENDDPLLHTEYRDYNRDLKERDILRLPRNTEPIGEECDNYINACFLYRSSAAHALECRYASDLVGLEDYDFWLRMQRCGKIIHAETMEPLYRYRVHTNTMSDRLLTVDKEQHVQRAEKMIRFEKERKEWADKRWSVLVTDRSAKYQEIRNICEQLPVNFTPDKKNIVFCDASGGTEIKENSAYCSVSDGAYHLGRYINKEWTERVRINLGSDISPLSLKSRYTHAQRPYYEYSNTRNLPVIGCHIDISRIETDETVSLVRNNPDCYFVFVASSNNIPQIFVRAIAECSNAVFLGERSFGIPYMMYSTWDATFIPPTSGMNENDIETLYQLSLSLGKWCAYHESYAFLNAKPYATPYGPHYDFADVAALSRIRVDYELMDKYLSTMSRKYRFWKLLRYADGMMQDVCVKRPDFKCSVSEEHLPVKIRREKRDSIRKLSDAGKYVAVICDSLNKGGMEQVIAMLVRKLDEYGVDVRVLCTQGGGAIADELINEKIEVVLFDSDLAKYEQYLRNNPPSVANTHFLHTGAGITCRLGIPTVETIHNMYAFYNEADWSSEKERTKNYDHFIAVSRKVKEYYCHFGNVGSDKVSVIGNAAQPSRLTDGARYFREMTGLSDDDYVFLCVASFDGRKNHLGLITAFSEACRNTDIPLKLILLGNILDHAFYNKSVEYINRLQCADRIRIIPYRQNVASVYADADAVILPSYIEGWSISATEAQYAGLPVIHSDCGSGEEICAGGEYGILISNPAGNPMEMDQNVLYASMVKTTPENTEELVSAILDMAGNRENWKRKAPAIRTRAIEEFNIDVMAEKYLDLLAGYCVNKRQ